MHVVGVVSVRLTIVYTSGMEGPIAESASRLREVVCGNKNILPADIPSGPPTIVSSKTLDEALASLGISLDQVRLARRLPEHADSSLETLVGCNITQNMRKASDLGLTASLEGKGRTAAPEQSHDEREIIAMITERLEQNFHPLRMGKSFRKG